MANQPKKLGKYNIVGKLGKGAMGEVYKGHDPVLNRFVAIKVIAESLDADPELVERFRREAKAAAQLNHPNIITIYDFVEEEGSLYIVMELLDGKDLKELIKGDTALTMEQILGIMEQIADGLGFAHENKMVHRDLKPANIHVTKKGQIKILDFGLVHNESSDMTKTGHVMGTPNYMSPEQVQGLKIDPRSDIFSIGAVFYELLTRKKPFSGDSIHATMFKVVQGDREPLAQYTHLPTALIQMVDRALDPNVDGRFADGNALREHIRSIRAEALARGNVDLTVTRYTDPTMTTLGSAPGSHPSGSSPSRSLPLSQSSAPSQSPSALSASGSRGTMRQREMTGMSMGVAASTSKPIGLYVAGAAVVLAIAAGAFYFTRSEAGSGPSVEELSLALIASQQELMVRSLEQRDYGTALAQAQELLANDAQNAEAVRVRDAAENALAQVEVAVGEARAALARGASEEAAEALGRVLALDPNHPLGAELNEELNQHFQSQAESAQADMTQARSAASSAGATSRAEFQRAESLRQQASDDFNGGEYTVAAQGFLTARDGYQQATSAHQQAESARSAQAQQAQQTAQAQAEAQAVARAELDGAQNAWTRLRSQPDQAGVREQPSYQRAMSEETNAKRLASSGDLSGAARGYQTAASYLEGARREYREAESRRAQQEARAAPPPPAPPPSRPAPATPRAPSVGQEEAAIRQALATYERAIEGENLDLFRQIKPNLSAADAKRLQSSFDAIDSQEVELDIQSILIEGDRATVKLTRRDVIVIRGRSQNGSSRAQTFVLAKTAGSWVITQIGQ